MLGLVLYRKHRPQKFAEIVGQQHVVRTLTGALAMGIVGHAYLFSGPRGTGKTTMARLLAKALNCHQRKDNEAEPCAECISCKEISSGAAMDVIEIDAASNRGIDEMRNLREHIRFAPTSAKYKVIVVDECHMLTKEASNAILKTLEEPPSHTIFVLATTEIHKVLPTIISRCQRFEFKKLNREEIMGRLRVILKREGRALGNEAISHIINASGGSLRDAESLLASVLVLGDNPASEDVRVLLGVPDMKKAGELVNFIAEGQKEAALSFLNILSEEGTDMEQFSKGLVQYARGLLLAKVNPDLRDTIVPELNDSQFAQFESHRQNFTEDKLYTMTRKFIVAENEVKYAGIPQLPIELAVVEIMGGEEKNSGVYIGP